MIYLNLLCKLIIFFLTMPRRNKRTRHCLAAIKKRWNQLDTEVSDTEYDEFSFNTAWQGDGDEDELVDND